MTSFKKDEEDKDETLYWLLTKLNNLSKNTLNEYGKEKINKITILMTPVNSNIESAINLISFGKYNELKDRHGFDKMYHVGLLLQLKNGAQIVVEKNEGVDIYETNNAIKEDTETMKVDAVKSENLTLNEFIKNTILHMGEFSFIDYDAFGTHGNDANNCQNFAIGLLSANGLMQPKYVKFFWQDIKDMRNDMNNEGFSYVPLATKAVTKISSWISRLIGKGKIDKKEKDDIIRLFERVPKRKRDEIIKKISVMVKNNNFSYI